MQARVEDDMCCSITTKDRVLQQLQGNGKSDEAFPICTDFANLQVTTHMVCHLLLNAGLPYMTCASQLNRRRACTLLHVFGALLGH
eukprot:scaffold249479_cov21-Tisochrysis_lutea.AAC.1